MANDLKRKTTMVLHQIEESLGNFVLANGDIENFNLERLNKIHEREVEKGRTFNKKSIKDIVEATYLDELFGFALDIANDSSMLDSINYLYSLFHYLDIYDIRNAISHPNRPFWDCYWYRVASIASDPVNERLGLENIREALKSAEDGLITDPPEEWVNKVFWQIPNNLPEHFDHSLTGLIGRVDEFKELKKLINNARINTIALIAPGGAGKTALALEFLNNIITTPSFSSIIDSVIFISMKTEKLTADGIIPLDAIQTIDELKGNITHSLNEIYDYDFESFEEATKQLSNQKILLCIDNLETLLRDHQESFENFNQEIPALWKILVTSRITISNASVISLKNLKNNSALVLAKAYLSKRGGQSLPELEYEKLVKSCFYNPLAIRLTIDLLLKGYDIPSSLNVAAKEISEFSYNNLINALTENAVEVLEAMFVENDSTRSSLCDLLEKPIDDISSAIGELSRTSLIIRNTLDQGESYQLSDSVKELLLVSPKNIIVRNQVQAKILNRRNLSLEIDIRQSEKEHPVWHTDYIPKETPENLKILVTEVNKKFNRGKNNPETAIQLYKKVNDLKFIYEDDALFQITLGRVFELLNDFNSAEKAYKKSILLEKDNPRSHYLLGRLYHETKKFIEAKETYENLINMGWIKEDDVNFIFGKSIYDGLFLASLYLGQFENVLEQTKKWKDAGKYREILGIYRASAWKRKAEGITETSQEVAVKALVSSVRIFSDVFRTHGFSKNAVSQVYKLYEEIAYHFSRENCYSNYPTEGLELLNFISENIYEITSNKWDINGLLKKLSLINIEGNPFKTSFDLQNESLTNFDDNESVNGLIAVRVTYRPKDKAKYLFAKDSNGESYFLHFDNVKNGNWRNWTQIGIGNTLYILPSEVKIEGKAIEASEVFLVSP